MYNRLYIYGHTQKKNDIWGSGILEYIRYFLIYEIFKACIYKKFIYKSFNWNSK